MAPLLRTPDELRCASDTLQTATRAFYAALKTQSAARYALDEARARALAAGIEGKNAEVRDAQLRLSLASEHDALERASVALNDCRAALECSTRTSGGPVALHCARAAWDCLRYEVRLSAVTLTADLPF